LSFVAKRYAMRGSSASPGKLIGTTGIEGRVRGWVGFTDRHYTR
jgi:hypothetical protein